MEDEDLKANITDVNRIKTNIHGDMHFAKSFTCCSSKFFTNTCFFISSVWVCDFMRHFESTFHPPSCPIPSIMLIRPHLTRLCVCHTCGYAKSAKCTKVRSTHAYIMEDMAIRDLCLGGRLRIHLLVLEDVQQEQKGTLSLRMRVSQKNTQRCGFEKACKNKNTNITHGLRKKN
jgi:hypothetical protein